MNSPALAKVSIYHTILWSKYKGGVFSQVHALGCKRGIDVSVTQIAETEGSRVSLNGVDLAYHNYPYRLLFRGSHDSISWYRRAYAATRDVFKYPADLVVLPGYYHVEHWTMLLACMLLRRKRATFSDSTTFDTPTIGWREIAKRFFLAQCDGCFTYGERSKEYLLSYGVDESKIYIRRQAAALPLDYDARKVLSHYTSQAPGSYQVPRFVFIGRLSVEKGLNDLLKAFKRLLQTLPTAKLDLVGAGPQRDELVALTHELGLDDSVTFLGSKELEELPAILYRAVALVLPSLSEPWGLVVNESLSYGCPVVVSEVCGCVPELVLDGITGHQHQVSNVDSLLDGMLKVVKMSDDRLATAKRCLDVIANFSPEQTAAQMLDGCESILRNGKKIQSARDVA